MIQDGYSICFNAWILDTSIKNELNLLLLISSLTAKNGYCIASNQYFAKIFDIHEKVVSKKIQKLAEKNYIKIEYEKRGCEVIRRYIRLTKMLTDECQKDYSTSNKKITYNNTSIKNKEIYNKEKEDTRLLAEQNTEVKTKVLFYGLAEDELVKKTIYNWNECLASQYNFPKISSITSTRLNKLKRRVKQAGGFREFWERLQESIEESKFLKYGTETWKCNFDFILQESSFQKIIEKQYK